MSKISIKIHDEAHKYGKTVEVSAGSNVGELATEFARTRGVARGKMFTLLPKGAEDRTSALSIKDTLSTAGVAEGAEFELLELMLIDDPDFKQPAPAPIPVDPADSKTTTRKKTTRRKTTGRKKTTRRKTTAAQRGRRARSSRRGVAGVNGAIASVSPDDVASGALTIKLGDPKIVWPVLVNGRETGTVERSLAEVLGGKVA